MTFKGSFLTALIIMAGFFTALFLLLVAFVLIAVLGEQLLLLLEKAGKTDIPDVAQLTLRYIANAMDTSTISRS